MSKAPPPFARPVNPLRRPQARPPVAQERTDQILALAKAHFDRGEIKQTEKLCMAVLTRQPGNVDALLLAASLAKHVDDAAMATGFLRRASQIRPNALGIRLALASALE